jgi:adenylate kinase
MYNILMLGSQGAGKGTQSARLTAKLGIPTISVGHLFRSEIESRTGLGGAIIAYIDKGERVPDMIVDQLMDGRLHEDDAENGVILDGYPRTLEQQNKLDDIFTSVGRKLTHVIYLRVDDEVAIKRLSGRRVCTNHEQDLNYHLEFNPSKEEGKCDRCGSKLVHREDDKAEAISRRLELYHHDTQPLIDFYRELGLLIEVDGSQAIEKVESDINAALAI